MVIGVMAVLLALLVPAFRSMKRADDITNAAATVVGTLEQARTFAMANNTYVWVGFFEEDAVNSSSANPRAAGVGRIILSVVASRHGNRYRDTQITSTQPHAFYPPPGPTPIPVNDLNPVILTQLGRLVKVENSHLAVIPDSAVSRPVATVSHQVGTADFTMHGQSDPNQPPVVNPTTFNYPVTAATGAETYTFTKIIEFNTRGEATKIVDLPVQQIEIGIRPANGNIEDVSSANFVAIQVMGATGKTRSYRP